jgi:hypothetical protein
MMVNVDSADVEQMLFAVAFMQEMRLRLDVGRNNEYIAHLAIAENTLLRISKEAMLESPVAKAFMAAYRELGGSDG